MNKILSRFFVLSAFLFGSLSAQSFVGKLNPYPVQNSTTIGDTLKLLAVMVEFQADEDDATFGDGTFGSIYSQDYGNNIIDPLPHDANYFRNHLLFAKNYFNKVSKGKLQVEFTVLDDVYSVSKVMREYSPAPNAENDFSSLASFAGEVWTLVDEANPGFDFAGYDLFTIFHAGVGRDIDVPGSIGNDRDLPSVYLSLNALKRAIDESFEGFPVQAGTFNITNTMILPSTESRELESFGEITLIELSTNGLIVASIASHLGLPDLFNTETGLSAIGRFGLMDGQSIFTFGGLFPPEPSPWEKMYLGWIEPVLLDPKNMTINLIADEIASGPDTSYIKIPINASEYYLVENRSRDAKKDGATVTFTVDGQSQAITFDKDYDTFISFNVDTLSGVITDVDEYDWAVPAFDRNDADIDEFTDVGIVIWHIDEAVIHEKLESNTINNDKFLKGVRVVEADGIDDIGEEFQTIFGDFVIGEGSKEDTWYRDNPSELYRNRFNSTSSPAAVANSGANSLISFSNFSDIDVSMSFDVAFGSGAVSLASTFRVPLDKSVKWIDAVSSGESTYYVLSDENILYAADEEGTNLFGRDRKLDYKPGVVIFEDDLLAISSTGREISVSSLLETNSVMDSMDITTSPVIIEDQEKIKFYMGNRLGFINLYETTNRLPFALNGISTVKAFNDSVKQVAADDAFVSAISRNAYWDSVTGNVTLEAKPLQLAIAKNNGEHYSIVLLDNNSIEVYNKGAVYSSIEFPPTDAAVIKFSLGDLKGDGSTNIVFNYQSGVLVYNLQGAAILNIQLDSHDLLEASVAPLLIDFDGDNLSDIIAFSASGKIFAFSGKTGEEISPFPLSFAGSLVSNPVVFSSVASSRLFLIDESNFASIWNLSEGASKIDWGNVYGDSFNSSAVEEPSSANRIPGFFPKAEAYNWPNPVYDNVTYFHFYVGEDSDVEINIFDLAGDRVDKLSKTVIGGFENQISWDVTNIESGVYLAHLNVKSVNGASDYKIIKVAVIK